MSKAELFQQLESLSREDLDEVAGRIDQLRGADLTGEERALLRSRITEYRKDPDDVVDLDNAVAEILKIQE